MSRSTALRLSGRDALALLHRISTNALDDLAPGAVRATLFCDFRGRLQHRAVAALTADGAVWLLRDDAPGAPLAAFVDRHVFRDDVRIEDRSAELPVWPLAEAGGVPPGTLTERDGAPALVRAVAGEALGVGGRDGPPADRAERERARVRAARPGHGHEIVEAFTPFEVALAHEVHLDKGCFTGQEALLRLVTRGSVRRRLSRLAGPGVPPAVPCALEAEGGPAGVLTSAIADGRGWIGLAVLRRELCEPPRALWRAGQDRPLVPEPVPLTSPLGRP